MFYFYWFRILINKPYFNISRFKIKGLSKHQDLGEVSNIDQMIYWKQICTRLLNHADNHC